VTFRLIGNLRLVVLRLVVLRLVVLRLVVHCASQRSISGPNTVFCPQTHVT